MFWQNNVLIQFWQLFFVLLTIWQIWECSCFSLTSHCCSFPLWQFNLVLTEYFLIKFHHSGFGINFEVYFIRYLGDNYQVYLNNIFGTFWMIFYLISLIYFWYILGRFLGVFHWFILDDFKVYFLNMFWVDFEVYFIYIFWYICISLLQFPPLTVQFCLPHHLGRDGTGEIMIVGRFRNKYLGVCCWCISV